MPRSGPEYAAAMGVDERARRVGHDFLYRACRGERAAGLTMVDAFGDPSAAHRAFHGVETRDPTADIDVVAYCFGVPPEQYLVEGVDRPPIRRAMWGVLPELVFDQPPHRSASGRLVRKAGEQAGKVLGRDRRARNLAARAQGRRSRSSGTGAAELAKRRVAQEQNHRRISPGAIARHRGRTLPALDRIRRIGNNRPPRKERTDEMAVARSARLH